jgi:hypothetical protein
VNPISARRFALSSSCTRSACVKPICIIRCVRDGSGAMPTDGGCGC